MNRRSSDSTPLEVGLLAALLGGYEATRPPAGVAGTGLPAASQLATRPEPLAERDLAAARELRPIAERRGERRAPVRLTVTATHPASEVVVDGTTVDISLGGMCVLMEGPPLASFVDVAVGDGAGRSTVWACVLDDRPVTEGGYLWHLRVLAGDRPWERLVSHVQVAKMGNRKRLRSVS